MHAGDEIENATGDEIESDRALDLQADKLVARVQAGDSEAYGDLYSLYFERVFRYLRVVLKNTHDAEDIAQQVFIQVMEKLPAYQRRSQPFRAWLFVVARNHAINHLRKLGRVEVEDPAELDRRREREAIERGEVGEDEPPIIGWITDRDLTLFVERLPIAQRQVLLLRFLLDLTIKDTARTLHRTESDVKVLQSRAIGFLRERLTAVGRKPEPQDNRKDKSRMRAVPKQAPVLRTRRFSLF